MAGTLPSLDWFVNSFIIFNIAFSINCMHLTASGLERFTALPLSPGLVQYEPVLSQLTQEVKAGRVLAEEQVVAAVESLVSDQVSAPEKAEFLLALSARGETVEEIAGFARALRDKSIQPVLDDEVRGRMLLDVCGTGGDRMNTFNISTTVALLVSAAGATVAKHGNRAVTSSSGSADVLAALGIAIELTPDTAGAWLKDYHFAFFFAPRYHPAFRNIAPARALCAQQGRRTVFNILGPLLNPAHPRAQIIGVPGSELCEPMARVLRHLGIDRGLVVCGQAGDGWMDEVSILGPTVAAGYSPGCNVSRELMNLAGLPLGQATAADLTGGDARTNAEIILAILEGHDRGPRRAAAQVNAAAALWIAGHVESLRMGWDTIDGVIDNGIGLAQLERLRKASAL